MNNPTLDNVTEALSTFLRENILAEKVDIGPKTDLASLGVDSFSLMEIILFVERKFQLLIPVEELTPEVIATLTTLSLRTHELLQENSAL